MKLRTASLAACFLFLGASGALGADSTSILFSLELGPYCETSAGSTPEVIFPVTGGDTSTQTGVLELRCTVAAIPVVTVTGGDVATPPDDFAGTMTGPESISFTGAFIDKPSGAGLATPIQWTYSATATGLTGKLPGSYSKALTFSISP